MSIWVWHIILTYLYVRTKVTISLKTISGQLILIWCEEQQQQKILHKVASKAKL